MSHVRTTPPFRADHVGSLLADLERPPLLAHLGQRVRPRHADRVRLRPFGDQPRPLVPAYLHLLRHGRGRLGDLAHRTTLPTTLLRW